MEQSNDKSSDTKTTSVSKTRQVQIDKIMQFVREHNEQIIGKVAYDNLWITLTTDLNNLGPPTNTTKKWRQIWSSYKYNNKKRFTDLISSSGHQDASSSRSNEPVSGHKVSGASSSRSNEPVSGQNEEAHDRMDGLEKSMSEVLERQDEIIKTLQQQTAAIERSNILLEIFFNKIK